MKSGLQCVAISVYVVLFVNRKSQHRGDILTDTRDIQQAIVVVYFRMVRPIMFYCLLSH